MLAGRSSPVLSHQIDSSLNAMRARIIDLTMNASEKPRPSVIAMISSEALVGIGITIAGLGFVCLLLALAEHLRSVPKIALVWGALGAVLMIAGGFTATFGWSKDRRR
jgi:hypothetical protein